MQSSVRYGGQQGQILIFALQKSGSDPAVLRRGQRGRATQLQWTCSSPCNSLQESVRMQVLRTVSLAAVAAVQIVQPAIRSEPVLVTSVFDGDTVDVAGIGHVRLLGIDAPELGRGFD